MVLLSTLHLHTSTTVYVQQHTSLHCINYTVAQKFTSTPNCWCSCRFDSGCITVR